MKVGQCDLATLRHSGCAWVTGAGSGIGAAVSRRLVRDGWEVAGSARNNKKLEALRRDLGKTFHPYPMDVRELKTVRKSFATIEAAHGPVSLAILNAGVYEVRGDRMFDPEAAKIMFETNVLGTINTLGVVLSSMMEQERGQLAVMSSLAGYRGLPNSAGYCASRAATLALAESLREDCRAKGVKVQAITPGFVKTPMTAKNTFTMPFLIEPEVAAAKIMAGLNGNRFEITFPFRLSILMKLLRILPYFAYFPLVRRIVRSEPG